MRGGGEMAGKNMVQFSGLIVVHAITQSAIKKTKLIIRRRILNRKVINLQKDILIIKG